MIVNRTLKTGDEETQFSVKTPDDFEFKTLDKKVDFDEKEPKFCQETNRLDRFSEGEVANVQTNRGSLAKTFQRVIDGRIEKARKSKPFR